MGHRFTSLFTHLIFSTKDRVPFLDSELAPECWAYIGGIVENIGGRRIEIGGVSDHLHLLLDMPATMALSDCVRTIKANSSKWIHEKWPRRSKFHWQQGYAAFSVSRSAVDRVIRYIRNQEKHHRRVTYQDEVRQFLKQHGMECDERYMWE
jgi:REP element-mobilizing transposase RayT